MTIREFKIGKMDCVGCAQEVESALKTLDGVESARVEYITNTLELVGDVDFGRLRERVEALGKTISEADEPAADQPTALKRAGLLGFWDYLLGRGESRLAIVGGALLLIAIAVDLLRLLPPNAGNVLYLLAMIVAIKPIAASGFNSLRVNRVFNINMLMTVAALGALLLGEFMEAATVIFLFAIGEALEGYTADRARDSLRSLVALKPLTAQRIDRGRVEVVPVEQLRIDDRIRVLPGEKIPMDGAVLAGNSAVDQAHISGESLPLDKAPGDEVFAGSINGEAALEIRVSRLSSDNTLSRIIELLRKSQARRAPSQRLIDRFAHVYTPAVALSAVAVACIPPLLLGGSFWNSADGSGWLYRALSMLVIACPCALVISTPVTVISAITSLARRGVLVKGGAALETLAGTRVIAFDKTGTLTHGRLNVMATYTDDCADAHDCEPCAELIALAAALEAQSTHPFAKAILQAAAERGLAYAEAAAVETVTGLGVRGTVAGKRVTIGSHRYFDQEFAHSSHLCGLAAAIEESGCSAIMLHDGDSPFAALLPWRIHRAKIARRSFPR